MSDASKRILIKIPPRGFEELEQLAKHADKLGAVVKATESIPLGYGSASFSDEIARQTKIDPGAARLIYTGLANLKASMERTEVSAHELLDEITKVLQAGESKWTPATIDTWNKARPSIESVLSELSVDHTIFLRQKAHELTYAHQNIFRSGRIITDVRPVFDAAGDKIPAAVLTHVLTIEYYDGVRNQHIEFALDEEDVDALQKLAERARKKTATTRELFQALSDCQLIVAGSSSEQPNSEEQQG